MRKLGIPAAVQFLFLLVYCSRLWPQGQAYPTELEPDDPDQDPDYHEDYALEDVPAARIVAGCEEGMFQCADR